MLLGLCSVGVGACLVWLVAGLWFDVCCYVAGLLLLGVCCVVVLVLRLYVVVVSGVAVLR